ncbi:cob(I)yrinic acid a,c-diamide adenosyltransferase [Glaciecola siphonariae]|uniref:Corrinoid adenosyltransferase n=1 Tax=Glaciecola siphonariae TaxID=521012 RepID=A0ABV9LUK3_9ALTE
MKIYTKQGDAGQTQVYAKEVIRLDKDDAILQCYGTLDELNAWIGLVAAQVNETVTNNTNNNSPALAPFCAELQLIQQHIFSIGFAISDQANLSADMVEQLEASIDNMQQQLRPQTKFILPGGSITASHVHVARTVARRAERCIVSLSKVHDTQPLALAFINRLSDYLFVFARLVNHLSDIPDVEV